MSAPRAPGAEPAPRLQVKHGRNPAVFLICGFGAGFVSPAPGTWGTLVGLLLWWLLLAGQPLAVQGAAMAAVFALGTWLTHLVVRRYEVEDDPAIVVDEYVGLWLALLVVPPSLVWGFAGFIVFRAFDILKPWPVSVVDRRVPGALGVMLDDLVAGGLALPVLALAVLFLA